MADLPRPAAMWILSFAILAVILYERPDGHKLLTTIAIAHRRDPDLARTTPLPPTNRSESMHRTDAETRTDRIVPGPDETHRSAMDPSNPDPCNLKHKTSIANAHKLSSDPSADGAPDADCHRMAPGDGRKISPASCPDKSRTNPAHNHFQDHLRPTPSLARERPRCIGDNRCRGRRASARCGIAPSRTPRHHAAASTPRTTACLTALPRQPLLTLPAAPPCRSPKPRAPRAPREPQWTPPWHTAATAQAGAARAPRRPPRKHCLPPTPLTSRYTP